MSSRTCRVCGLALRLDPDLDKWLDEDGSPNCALAQERANTTMAVEHDGSSPRIIRMLDLSTAHLPKEVAEDLTAYDGVIAYPLSTSDAEYGWLLWVPEHPDQRAADYGEADADPQDVIDGTADGIPAAVLAIWHYARAAGCDYVLLDRGAERVAGLPTWDW